jgi:antitoxin FitA
MAEVGVRCKGEKIDSIDITDSSDIIASMASMTIRNLPDETKRLIRVRAAENGRSMEEEVRERLIRDYKPEHAKQPAKTNWVEDLIKTMQGMGDAELELPPHLPASPPPDFSGPEFD